MKILYISPENTVGTLTLWKKEHSSRGHECRTVTFFKSPKNFKEDICLELPFNFTGKKMASVRNWVYQQYRGDEGYFKSKDGYPPKWTPEGRFDSLFLSFKDWLWRPIIKRAIDQYDLTSFDVVHFESGMDFLKDESFVETLSEKGIKIMQKNRKISDLKNLSNGPAKLAQSLEITKKQYGIDLTTDSKLFITEGIESKKIIASPRIGIKEAADKLWNFKIEI